jgi:D-3-phosphoglycerate dehydrogenase
MISKAKPGAIVINTSRGEILDESALAESLRRGDLFGVGVDVLSGESEPDFSLDESPLVCALEDGFNVLITPHIGGWATSAVFKARAAIVEKFLIEYFK